MTARRTRPKNSLNRGATLFYREKKAHSVATARGNQHSHRCGHPSCHLLCVIAALPMPYHVTGASLQLQQICCTGQPSALWASVALRLCVAPCLRASANVKRRRRSRLDQMTPHSQQRGMAPRQRATHSNTHTHTSRRIKQRADLNARAQQRYKQVARDTSTARNPVLSTNCLHRPNIQAITKPVTISKPTANYSHAPTTHQH